MTFRGRILMVVGIVAISGLARAQRPSTVTPGSVVLSVGDRKITRKQIDELVGHLPKGFPPEKRQAEQARIINELIFKNLVGEYLRANHVQHTEEDRTDVQQQLTQLAQQRGVTRKEYQARMGLTPKDIENLARSLRMQKEAASPEKVAALIKAHPAYFDGTRVRASHVLIPCSPLASTAKQTAALAKSKRIQAALLAGQIDFADAAKRYSSCPSKVRGGDLGEFAFPTMAPPFAKAAFDANVGDVTEIIRTEYGFHLLYVTGRTDGAGTPGPRAPFVAQQLLLAELQNRIFAQALTTVPVVIAEEAWDKKKPAPPAGDAAKAQPPASTAPTSVPARKK